jgi:hypothetical protein
LSVVPRGHYFDALAWFHERGGNLAQAVRVRDRELSAVQGKGQHVHEWDTHRQRCQVLARMGKLGADDLAAAHAVAARMRRPEKYLAELQALGWRPAENNT